MTSVVILSDKRETDLERLHKGKHLIILLLKEDWFGVQYGKEIHETISEYKKMNPNYARENILVIAEQIIVEAGATLVSYNTMYIPY